MKKEIKDTKRERPEGKCLENSWAVFNRIFIKNNGPSHSLKGRTFFFITFAKKFIIQVTWNMILYHWQPSHAIDYGKLLFLYIIAFAWNAKSFAIVILVLFLFFLLVTFSGQTGKSYFQSFVQWLLWARGTRIGVNNMIWRVLSTHVL